MQSKNQGRCRVELCSIRASGGGVSIKDESTTRSQYLDLWIPSVFRSKYCYFKYIFSHYNDDILGKNHKEIL